MIIWEINFMEETDKILAKIDFLRIVFAQIITLLPKFDIADKTVLPYGLKPTPVQ